MNTPDEWISRSWQDTPDEWIARGLAPEDFQYLPPVLDGLPPFRIVHLPRNVRREYLRKNKHRDVISVIWANGAEWVISLLDFDREKGLTEDFLRDHYDRLVAPRLLANMPAEGGMQ